MILEAQSFMEPSRAACSTWITKSNGTSQHHSIHSIKQTVFATFWLLGSACLVGRNSKTWQKRTRQSTWGRIAVGQTFLFWAAELWLRVFAQLQDIRNYAASLVSATSMHGGKSRKNVNVFLWLFVAFWWLPWRPFAYQSWIQAWRPRSQKDQILLCRTQLHGSSSHEFLCKSKWGFPKMGVSLNFPFLDGIFPYQ